MKLVIQIPSYNEAETLPQMLNDLPDTIPGVDEISILIINDGSTDGTEAVAKAKGCHVVSHTRNLGLARSFMTGIETALSMGADLIVNTDADNQYDASCIADLLQPILRREAEMVIGERPIESIDSFSWLKKRLQRVGSRMVAMLSGTQIRDAPSGFRAFSRKAAEQLNVFSEYTYTLETLIQAGHRNIPLTSVPIRVNRVERPSRLVKSIPSYIRRSVLTMFHVFLLYSPMKFFFTLGTFFVFLGMIPGIRFIYHYFSDGGAGKVQSLIFMAVLIVAGLLCYTVGLITDLIAVNRQLLEDIRVQVRRLNSDQNRGN
ncbi:MAG: glycosyltransferase family 2 protein [Verrucomicrobia bacterium]|nr:glycosyltransferase family 2 protein [Verrucomicrobiota bacterium]MCH8511424.1 glycosyltransferase family 2 protein [Kiritimatiellia bacterium]